MSFYRTASRPLNKFDPSKPLGTHRVTTSEYVEDIEPSAADMEVVEDSADEGLGEITYPLSSMLPTLLTPDQVGNYLGVSVKTLERWRSHGEGPHYVRISSGTIRYRAHDIEAFITGHVKSNTLQ